MYFLSIGNIIEYYTDMGLYWSDIVYFYIYEMRLCDFCFSFFVTSMSGFGEFENRCRFE